MEKRPGSAAMRRNGSSRPRKKNEEEGRWKYRGRKDAPKNLPKHSAVSNAER